MPSFVVDSSSDGGRLFDESVVVAHGTGEGGVQVFHDKSYLAVDTSPSSPFYGSLYITWTRFRLGPQQSYIGSPIYFAFSADGGHTFSTPTEISGNSATLCAHPFRSFNTGRCNEDMFSTPIVGPDGTLYVAFENDEFQGTPEFRNQYLVVRSTDSGQTF